MPEGRKSEPTLMVEALVGRMTEAYEILVKEWDVPFLKERVSPSEFKRRWEAMTPEQRRELMNEIGLAETLSTLRGEQGGVE